MSNFQDLISRRRSIRKYTEQTIAPEHVELLLKAALKSPTSKNLRSWRFILVEDKEQLKALSQCKKAAGKFVVDSALSIVVAADAVSSDAWIEDASIASIMIQLQAEELGLGSCWVQVRNREREDESSSEQYVKDLLDLPIQLQVLSIISIGHKAAEKEPFNEDNLEWDKVYIGKYE